MKQQTRILIYILIGIAAVVIGSIGIIGSFDNDIPTGQEHIDLGRVYLTELSYEEAVMEFTEAIEIEPLNPEAYLGLAEAYVGMGDNERAVEVLENGYDKTGDERLLKMLEELLPQPEETAVTTEATTVTSITTEETTTVSTVEMAVVPDLSGLSEEEAIAACEEVGLLYNVSYNYNDDVPEGVVIRQSIPGDSAVAKGVKITVNVSKGKEVTVAVTTATTVETVITTTAITTAETSVITTVITTTPAPETTTSVSEEEENEKTYDDSGNLLYEKVQKDEGYELWWYYPAKKNSTPVIHAIEKYDSNGKMTYSTIYDKNGKKIVEGEPILDDNGYSIKSYDKKNKENYNYKINKDRYIYAYFSKSSGESEYEYEYDYDNNYEYIEKCITYYADNGNKFIEDYFESEEAFEHGHIKRTVVYSNDSIVEIEYKTDIRDNARISRIYKYQFGTIVIVNEMEWDSNDKQRRLTNYENGEICFEIIYDENGYVTKTWNKSSDENQ